MLSYMIMRQNPKLKMLSVAFTGIDHIDLNYCRNKISLYAIVPIIQINLLLNFLSVLHSPFTDLYTCL